MVSTTYSVEIHKYSSIVDLDVNYIPLALTRHFLMSKVTIAFISFVKPPICFPCQMRLRNIYLQCSLELLLTIGCFYFVFCFDKV